MLLLLRLHTPLWFLTVTVFVICVRLYITHDDVIKWNHFPRNWPFVRGIPRSPVNSSHRCQWRTFVFFELRLNKRLGKKSRHRRFQTLSCSLWYHCNEDKLPEWNCCQLGLFFAVICITPLPTQISKIWCIGLANCKLHFWINWYKYASVLVIVT